MQELIQVTTGGQGQPVVSARALYEFLGFDLTQWARWSKKNIVNNPYAQVGLDWEGFDLMSSGNLTKDYLLTLDFAKRLSMLARTPKGEEIRGYFLDCEKKLALPMNQRLLQQEQLLMSYENRLAALEKYVSGLLQREEYALHLPEASSPHNQAIHTTRVKVVQLVNQYAEAANVAYYVIWNQVYNRLHVLYGFNIRAQRKTSYENLLDVAERYGQMDRLLAIVSSEFVTKPGLDT